MSSVPPEDEKTTTISPPRHGHHRLAVAQIDFNPAYAHEGKNLLQEPWPKDLQTTPLTSLFLGMNEGAEPLTLLCLEIERMYCETVKTRISTIVQWCAEHHIELLVFPEYSIPPSFLPVVQAWARTFEMTIVAGTHLVTREIQESGVYDSLGFDASHFLGASVAPVVTPSEVVFIPKLRCSQWEIDLETPERLWKVLNHLPAPFAVLICIDLLNPEEIQRGLLNPKEIQEQRARFIAVPSYTPLRSLEDFNKRIDLIVKGEHRPVLFANHPSGGGSRLGVIEPKPVTMDIAIPRLLTAGEEGVVIWDVNLSQHSVKRPTPTMNSPASPAIWFATPNLLEIGVMKGSSELQELVEGRPLAQIAEVLEEDRWQRWLEMWLGESKTPSAARKRLGMVQRGWKKLGAGRIQSLLRDIPLPKNTPSLVELRYHLADTALSQLFELYKVIRSKEILDAITTLSLIQKELDPQLRSGWQARVPRPHLPGYDPGAPKATVTERSSKSPDLAGAADPIAEVLALELFKESKSDLSEQVEGLIRLGKAQGWNLRAIGRAQEELDYLWWKKDDDSQELIQVVLDTAGTDPKAKIGRFKTRVGGYAQIECCFFVSRLRSVLHRKCKLERHAASLILDYFKEIASDVYYINLSIKPQDGEVTDTDTLLLSWCKDRNARLLTVLGDYGSGKTTLTRRWARDLAETYLNDSNNSPAPIRVDLLSAKDADLEKQIVRTLNHGGGEASEDLIKLALEQGLIVLILDSFDEMAQVSGDADIIVNFHQIERLIRGREPKIILTCRRHYFESERLMLSTLEEKPGYAAVELQRLTPDQVERYFLRRVPDVSRRLTEQTRRIHALGELCSHPLLLDMIVSVRDRLLSHQSTGLTRSGLYAEFVRRWLERSVQPDSILTTEKREEATRYLARRLWDGEDEGHRIDEFLTGAGLELHDKTLRLQAVVEMRTSTFILVDKNGNMRFSHTSFHEYFVALDIFKRLELKQESPLPERHINDEVAQFLDDMFTGNDLQGNLDMLLRRQNDKERKVAALVASYRTHRAQHKRARTGDLIGESAEQLRAKLADSWGRGLSFRRARFSGLSLRCASLVDADLSGVSWENGDLTEADLSGATLKEARLSHLTADRLSFRNADLTGANLERSTLKNCQLDDAKLSNAVLSDAIFEDTSLRRTCLENADFSRAKLINVCLAGAEASYASLKGALLWKVNAEELNLENADLSDCSLYKVSFKESRGRPLSIHNIARAPRRPTCIVLRQPPWQGGAGTPSAVAWSPSKGEYTVASWDGYLRVFDAGSGRLISELSNGHPVRDTAYSGDGTRIVAGCWDGVARVWSLSSNRREPIDCKPGTSILCCCLSPDGKILVTGDAGHIARIIEADSGNVLRELTHKGSVTSCAISQNGSRLYTADTRGHLRAFDTLNFEQKWEQSHPMKVRSCTVSPEGQWVLSGCADGKARLFDAETGEIYRDDFHHSATVLSCAFAPDGSRFATGSVDGKVRVFNVDSAQTVAELEHNGWVWSCAFSPSGRELLTSCDDGRVRLFETERFNLAREVLHGRWVRACAVSADGRKVLAACSDWKARLFDASNGQLLREFEHGLWVRSCDFAPDGSRVLTSGGEGLAREFDAHSGRLLRTMKHSSRVRACAYSADGDLVLTGCGDYKARIFKNGSEKPFQELEHDGEIWTCRFSQDKKRFLTGADSGTVRCYTIKDLSFRTYNHPGWVRSCDFYPDGQRFVTGCRDGKVRVFNIHDDSPKAEIPHPLEVWSCNISPDGSILATSSADFVVRIWDLVSYKLRCQFAHPGWVFTCQFFPDGHRIVTGCDDGLLRVFDLQDSEPILTIVAAFPIPYGRSRSGYFSLPSEEVALDVGSLGCDVRCETGTYPLELLMDDLNKPELVVRDVEGKSVPTLEDRIARGYRQVDYPPHWL